MHLQKILLGVTLAAPIGPVSIEMIKRGLKDGFWGAFNIRLGGVLGNTLCLIAAYFGLSALQNYGSVFIALGLLGSALLLYMGATTIKKAFKPIHLEFSAKTLRNSKNPLRESLILGFMLAILNPVAVVFWLSIFANDIDPNQPVHWLHLLYNMQIILGVLLWGVLLSTLLEFGRRSLSPKMIRFITFAAGMVLLYFGIKYGYQNILKLQA
ncbi:MAG TPA: LysE family transporter [Gammaproteobacteria bacterium]|nr:LysE family transporter [Gammaproteobacteria bacterium]